MQTPRSKKYSQAPGAAWLVVGASVIPALLTLIVYLPALENNFVEWDDFIYIIENPLVRGTSLGSLWAIFTTFFHCNWHPLTTLSWALDHSIWGLDPWGFHLSSIILHALNTLLASVLATMVSARYTGTDYADKRNLFVGAATALLFGLHPYHVESVAWVSERKDLLCQLFYILSIISYLKYNEAASGKAHYAAAFVFFILALMSKPMAVSLPIVLVILDFILHKDKPVKKIILDKIPFAALSLISSIITILAQRAGDAIVTLEEQSFIERIAVALRAYIFYLYKTIFPLGLSPYYSLPPKSQLFDSVFFISLLVFAGISIFSILVFKRRKYILAAWLFFIVTLAPVIGLVKVGGVAAADRYTYLPSLGVLILIGALMARLFYSNRLKLPVSLLVAFITVFLSYGTLKQIPVWKDTLSIWSKVIEEYPDTALAYYTRGAIQSADGRYEEALADYDKAISLNPGQWTVYYNRAFVLSQTGRDIEAVDDLTKAIELYPNDPDTYNNRGRAYIKLGRIEEAVADFERAIELDPSNAAARQNLQIINLKFGAR